MKKKIFVIICIFLVFSIINYKKITKEDKKLIIETYIDGKLAVAPPSSSDGYLVSNIACSNGVVGTFDYSTWRLKTSNITTKTLCTIEFVSNSNTNFNTYLKNKVCTSTPTTDAAAQNCLVNENGYRYEGSDPNNYILFNDELWRIIGVFNTQNSAGVSQDLVKIIKYDSIESIAWDGNNTNNWSLSTLQTQLNDNYYNSTDVRCNGYGIIQKNCNFSKTGLKKGVRERIESVVWHLGGLSGYSSDSNYNRIPVGDFYTYERGTIVYGDNPATWTGKIGLMYPSDYGYAPLASSCARTTKLYNYNTQNCAGNNWLFRGNYAFTITQDTQYGSEVYYIGYTGRINALSDFQSKTGAGIYPTIHLKSTVKYISGTGTYDDPYIVN